MRLFFLLLLGDLFFGGQFPVVKQYEGIIIIIRTKVLSKGSNILDQELEKPDDGLSSGAPIDVYDFDSVMEDLNKGMSLNIENITKCAERQDPMQAVFAELSR